MAVVFAFALVQGVMQVVGVTSIFPFLALASDPDQIKNSKIGSEILGKLPAMEDSELLLASGIGSRQTVGSVNADQARKPSAPAPPQIQRKPRS